MVEEEGKGRRGGVSWLLCCFTCLSMALTLYLVFFYAPTEKTMGVVQRIFYFHVSSAWVALFAFFLLMVFSAAYLVTTTRKWDHRAFAAAEVGALFCTLVMLTGILWDKPAWNVWWTWDLRLTTTLVLWLMYVVYLLLRRYVSGEQGIRFAAVFGIIAFLDVPFVYFSIRWWRTMHPPPVILGGNGAGLELRMLITLLVSVVSFMLLFFYLFQHRVVLARMTDELEQMRRIFIEQEQRTRDFRVENQDFIIEGYSFQEYKKDDE